MTIILLTSWSQLVKKKEIKKHVMRLALKAGVEKGILVQVKNSYKLSAEAKKPPKAPKKIDVLKNEASTKKIPKNVSTKSKTSTVKKAAPKKNVVKSATKTSKKATGSKKVAPKKAKVVNTATLKKDSTRKTANLKTATQKKPKAKPRSNTASKPKAAVQ